MSVKKSQSQVSSMNILEVDISDLDSISSLEKSLTPDQVLSEFGIKNFYIWWIWLSMGFNWGLSAMPMMVSAFLPNYLCVKGSNCTFQKGSISAEFNLTEDLIYLVDYTASAFLVGVALGSIIFPPISDIIGRRKVIITSMICMGLFGNISAFAPEIYSFIVFRFLQGCFFTGCGIATWVLAYESIPLNMRSYTALQFGLSWVLGYCMVSPLAFLIPNWRWLICSVSTPILICGFIYYFTTPESFHFLVTSGQHERISQWIERANFFEEKKVVIDVEKLCLQFKTNNKNEKHFAGKKNLIQHLLSNRVLLTYTLVLIYIWTCDSFVYYGLSLFSSRLAGNQYINFVLLGMIEIPSYLLSPFLLDKLGRQYFVSLCHFFATFSFVVIIFTESLQIHLLMWLIGKFAISCAFTSLFVYSSEIFPTVVRNGCIGVCEVVARLGGATAPLIQTMARFSPLMPTIFFAVFSGIAGLVTFTLPETANRELLDLTDQLGV